MTIGEASQHIRKALGDIPPTDERVMRAAIEMALIGFYQRQPDERAANALIAACDALLDRKPKGDSPHA